MTARGECEFPPDTSTDPHIGRKIPARKEDRSGPLVASSLLGSEDMLSAFWGLFWRSAPLLLTDSFWGLGEPSYSAQGLAAV